MVNITYQPDNFRVIVDGHAGSGKMGHDLVCAAVSILEDTLIYSISKMETEGDVIYCNVKFENGYTEIEAIPKNSTIPLKTVFDTICNGFRRLNIAYPKYITYTVK